MTAHPQRPPRVLLYGGTFNPVHNGHVSVLWQVQNALQADVVQVVPCHLPPHKQAPTAPNSHRLAMLTLALQELNAASGCQRFVLNTCELDRQGVSYTLHTLQAARQHWGADARLVWLLGMDSWQQLATWHRWQDLFPLTHFVVVERPGGADWASQQHLHAPAVQPVPLQQLWQSPAGAVAHVPTTPLAIASSAIRANLQQGLRPVGLVPSAVDAYLHRNGVYFT